MSHTCRHNSEAAQVRRCSVNGLAAGPPPPLKDHRLARSGVRNTCGFATKRRLGFQDQLSFDGEAEAVCAG
jgi:hypothetical protein